MEKTKTEFDRATTEFATESFRIAGWIGVIALFIVTGNKLDAPIAVLIGYALWGIASLYTGIRVEALFAYARYGNKKREFPKWRYLPIILGSIIFSLAISSLIKVTMQSLSL